MLDIAPVIKHAESVVTTIKRDLPKHGKILEAAEAVVVSAREAQTVSDKYKKAFGLHRLPAAFMALVITAFVLWGWWHFVRVATVNIAISETDAVDLGQQLHRRVQFAPIRTAGSRENVALVVSGKADAAFVQGGIAIPADLTRVELPSQELVLFFVRANVKALSDIRTILTSTEGQGSHTVAKEFARVWQIDGSLRFVHDWGKLVSDPTYRMAPEVDAVFVVKDPLDAKVAAVPRRLQETGFHLEAADIGIGALALAYLTPLKLDAGDIDRVAAIPAAPLSTYKVKTYLVARPDLNHRQLAVAHSLADPTRSTHDFSSALSSVGEASDLLQGLDAFLSILIYLGLAFFAVAGVDIIVYRKRFHELNALISRVCMQHASSRANIANKTEYVTYLRVCSDLIGIISVITGYYAQGNSSLLYDKLVQIIPQRCDSLRITIELEILHAPNDMQPGAMRANSG
jgi:hypothetical protein